MAAGGNKLTDREAQAAALDTRRARGPKELVPEAAPPSAEQFVIEVRGEVGYEAIRQRRRAARQVRAAVGRRGKVRRFDNVLIPL